MTLVAARPLPPAARCCTCATGYFTSRPTSKGYIRQAAAYLAAARQLQALAPRTRQPPAQAHSKRAPPPTPADAAGAAAAGGPPAGAAAGAAAISSSSSSSSSSASLDALEFAVSLTQHHDAVTGTEKQHVANDYAR
jgi:alpha-mannosidase